MEMVEGIIVPGDDLNGSGAVEEEVRHRRLRIKRAERMGVDLYLVGESPLISNRVSDLARKSLAKKTLTAKEKERLLTEKYQFEQSIYRDEQGRYAIRAMGVYLAILTAAERVVKREDCYSVRNWLALATDDELLPLELGDLPLGGPTPRVIAAADRVPEPRSDIVKNHSARVKTLAHRAMYRRPWGLRVPLIYNAEWLSEESVIALVEEAGYSVGIGCWRPDRKGTFGRFRVVIGRTIRFNLEEE